MGYGLDIGPGALRAAAGTSDEVTIESVPPVVTATDEEPLESADGERSAGLVDDRTGDGLFVEHDGTRYAVGPTASAVSDAPDGDPVSLFSSGVLTVEGYAEPAFEALIDDVLERVEPADGRLCYTTPGTLVDAAEPTDAHRETVESVLVDRGVESTPISRGFAVVYDQFAADNYTGLGICLGTQTTSVALSYYGVPALAFSLAKGSEWVVERAATETGRERTQVATVLEEFALDPDAATGGIESALAQAYDALIGEITEAIETEADENDVQQGMAIPIAVAGSGAVDGLEFLLGGRFDAVPLPFSVREVRLADDPAASAARGALAAAEDDVDAYEDVTWSASDADDSTGDGGGSPSSAIEIGGADEQTALTFDDDALGGGDAAHARADDAIEQLFDRLANRDEEIQSVRTDLESAVEELEYIEAQTADAQRVADLEETTADERTALENRLGDLASDLEGVTDRTDALDDRLERIQTALGELEAETASAADLEALTETVSRLDDGLEGIDEDVERIETRITGLAGRLEEQATRIGSVSNRADERAERADDERDRLADEIGTVESELKHEVGTVEGELEDEIDALETTIADEIGVVEDELETADDRLDEIDERIEAETDSFDERVADLGGQIETTTADIEAVETDLASTDDRVETLDDDLTDARKSANARSDALENRLESIGETIDELESMTADGERVSAVEDDLAALKTELGSLDGAVSALSETVAGVEERAASAESVDGITAHLETVESDIDDLEETVHAVEEMLEDRLDETAAGLETRFEETASDLERRLDEATATIDDRLTELEGTTERLEAGSADDETVVALSDSLADTRDAVESVTADLGDLRTEFAAETDALETRFDDVDGRSVGIESRLDEVSEAVGAVETDAERVTETVASLERDIETIPDDLESRLEDAVGRIDGLADDTTDLAGDADDLGDRTDRLDDRTSDHTSRLEEQAARLEDYDARFESLTTDIDDLATTLEGTPDESAVDSIRTRLSAVDERLTALESRVGATRSSRDDDLEEIRSELAALRERTPDSARDGGSDGLTALSPIVAGGGGAGVVTGGTLALTGAGLVGAAAVVVGLVLLGVAVAVAR
ncbi:disk-shape morphogenesis protein volactin [Natronorubrum halophilum]|uniref:chromosome segregation ATPase n=1 Tax=Natronorubrum halophilum TaxID=1702106 RepID=UPI0010C18201|nr:chromosome segregation ATPase [Natronorubrum halophilum]